MNVQSSLSDFGVILLFIIGGGLFLTIGLFVAKLVRPNRPNSEKLSTYESGEEPTGSAWTKFNTKYYTIALIFILFEVELIFLFPWATIMANKELIAQTNGVWGWMTLIETFLFIGILILGLAYAWSKGYIDWIKPNINVSDFQSVVPKEHYQKINLKYEKKKDG